MPRNPVLTFTKTTPKNVINPINFFVKNVTECLFFALPSIPREVEMAHKVLSKDMFELVATMKLAQQYADTTLDVEYRK